MTYPNTPAKIPNGDLVKLLPPQGMSRARDILPLLPFGRTTLHEWSRDGKFPASVRLSPTMVAWRNAEVLEWLENHSNPVNNEQESGCE
ncbi:AlpA family phage regulatory protein [uncultured Psychrobacter sp.]|uniref:helix-turn-helix transcriptional regulator n=2 Tax=Psychrobacter TaxID=497 RepID=UPI00262D391B|nr:AlpA family phage regulatory protein [uncultured Psychrobacter sp.]